MRFPDYLAYTPEGQRSIGRLVAHVFHPTSLTDHSTYTDQWGQKCATAMLSMGKHDEVHALTRFGLGRKVRRLVARSTA